MTVFMDSVSLFFMVFVRLAGMLLMNPMFSRRNVPSVVRMGLIFFLTILVMPTVDNTPLAGLGGFELALMMFRELAIGLCLGMAFQFFYMMLYFTGDLLDVTFGFSMAKVFDPGTNLQVAMSSSIFFNVFMLYLIATDSHLAIIHLFCYTFKALPLGGAVLTPELAQGMMKIFTDVFLLAIRLAMPFVAMDFVLEVGMGILMRFVPQIQVFSINFQLKQGLAFIMLFLFAPFVGSFMDNYLIVMLETMQNVLGAMGGNL